MQRRDFLKGWIAGAAIAASACSRRETASVRKLRLTAGKLLSMSPLFHAYESGYFRDAGYDLEVLQIPNPLDAMTLLAGGRVDVCFTGMVSSFLNAVIKNVPLRIVAGREIASPSCGSLGSIYGLRRNFPEGLADPGVLKGKRVAAGPTIGFSHFALDAQLESVGLTGDDVTSVNLPSTQAVAALLGGSVDAIVFNTEFDRNLTAMSADIVRGPGLAQVHPDFQCSYVYFGATLLESDPDIGSRFLAAYLRGAREFMRGATPRYMEDFARSGGLDVNAVTGACRDTFTPDGAVDLNSLQLFVDWAFRRKYIMQPVEVARLVDLRFLGSDHEK